MTRSTLQRLALGRNQLSGSVPWTSASFTAPLLCLQLRMNFGLCGVRPSGLPYLECGRVPGTALGERDADKAVCAQRASAQQ